VDDSDNATPFVLVVTAFFEITFFKNDLEERRNFPQVSFSRFYICKQIIT